MTTMIITMNLLWLHKPTIYLHCTAQKKDFFNKVVKYQTSSNFLL